MTWIDTEDSSQALRDWLDLALEVSELGRWQHDVAAGIMLFDERARRQYGLDSDVVTLDVMLNQVHPEDVPRVANTIVTALGPTGGGHYATEFRVIHPDGSTHWLVLQGRTRSQRDSAGRRSPIVFGICQDVTGRRQLKEETRASELRFRSIIEDQTEYVCRFDCDFKITFANSAYCKAFGLSPDAVKGLYLLDRIPVEERELALAHLRSLTRDHPVATSVHRSFASDGSLRWGEWKNRAIFNEQGNIFEYQGVGRDVTKEREAEAALRTSEERQRAILSSIPDLMILVGRDGTFLDHYSATNRMLMIHLEDFRGKSYEQVLPSSLSEQLTKAIELAKVSAHPVRGEFPLTLEGQAYRFETRVVPLSDGGCLLLVRDISEQSRAQAALVESEQKLRLFIEHAPAAIAMLDKDMCYLAVSQRWLTDYRLDDETIIGRSHYEVFPDIPERWRVIHRRCLLGAVEKCEADPFPRADGSLDWVRWEIRPWRETNGAIGGILLFSEVITERVSVEAALRQSEVQFQQFMHYLPASICILDSENRLRYCNPQYAETLDVAIESIVGKPLDMIVPPEITLQALDENRQVLDQNRALTFTYTTGSEPNLAYWRLIKFPIPRDGQLPLIGAISLDVTKEKQAEAVLKNAYELLEERVIERTLELQRTKDRLEAIFSHSGDAIVLLDVNHTIQQANRAFEDLLDISEALYQGQPLPSFFQPEEIHHLQASIQEAIATQYTQHLESRILLPDGPVRHVGISFAPVRRDDATVTNVVCILRDITRRKQAEAELVTMSHRLKLAAEAGGMAISETDVMHGKTFWDDQMYLLYGVEKNDALGSRESVWRKVRFHPEDQIRVHQEYADYFDRGDRLDTTFRILLPDGAVRHLRVKSILLRDDGGKPARAIGINWDITAEKSTAEALERALNQEKELGMLKSRLVSMASHEFRTPLASILATTETLTLYRDRMDEAKIDERLDRIRQQVHYMTNITTDVLQLTRIQSGRIKFAPSESDFAALCRDIVEEFEHQIADDRRLVYQAHSSPVIGEYDTQLLRQVVTNLIQNALKYSAPEKAVKVNLNQTDDEICLSVTDEGIGIPSDDLSHLFEPFHRAANVGAVPGTGLGLSIAKEAVDLHRGTITVESEVGVGTTFRVFLPKRLNENERAQL